VPSPLPRAALDRLSVTSGAHNADANRSGANTDGDIRNSDTADAKPSGANTDADTHNSGMAYNRSASTPWRRLWIVYHRR
jgi:hypothetical protein